jgi:hypothetical protein
VSIGLTCVGVGCEYSAQALRTDGLGAALARSKIAKVRLHRLDRPDACCSSADRVQAMRHFVGVRLLPVWDALRAR